MHWGYADDRSTYQQLLGAADIVASTADHEFFGIGIVEACAAGALPLVPNRLAYPEVLGRLDLPRPADEFIYGQTSQDLANAIQRIQPLVLSNEIGSQLQSAARVYSWQQRAAEMDGQLEQLVDSS